MDFTSAVRQKPHLFTVLISCVWWCVLTGVDGEFFSKLENMADQNIFVVFAIMRYLQRECTVAK
jgi:hypothetical protein